MTSDEVKEHIYKLAKKGLTPSQIGTTSPINVSCCTVLLTGVILRDSHGVSQVKIVTGNKILRILKAKGLCNFCCIYHFSSGMCS